MSRLPLDKQTKSDLLENFWCALGRLNKTQIKYLLKDLLSPVEELMLAKRLKIFKLLRQKYSYENIQKVAKVTQATISKMSLSLQLSNDEFKRIIEDLITDEDRRWKEFKDSRKPRWVGKMVHYVPK